MTNEPKTIRVGAIVATTDPLPRRGLRLSREALQGMVDHFRPGQPIFREHGVRQIGRGVSAMLRQRDDGEWEIYTESDIDIPAGETEDSVVAGLPRGWSIGFTELEEDRPKDPVVTLGIDSIAFTEQDRDEARTQFRDVPVSVYVAWYHQFADAPQAAVVMDLARQALMSLPPEVWNQLFKTLEEVVLRLIFREPRRTGPLVFRMRADPLMIDLEVPPDAKPEMVKEVFRGARSMLRPARKPRKPRAGN